MFELRAPVITKDWFMQSKQLPLKLTWNVPDQVSSLVKVPLNEYVVVHIPGSTAETEMAPPGQAGIPKPVICGTPLDPVTPSVSLPRSAKTQLETE